MLLRLRKEQHEYVFASKQIGIYMISLLKK